MLEANTDRGGLTLRLTLGRRGLSKVRGPLGCPDIFREPSDPFTLGRAQRADGKPQVGTNAVDLRDQRSVLLWLPWRLVGAEDSGMAVLGRWEVRSGFSKMLRCDSKRKGECSPCEVWRQDTGETKAPRAWVPTAVRKD